MLLKGRHRTSPNATWTKLRNRTYAPKTSKGASQRQSIYLILRSPLAQKRAVSKEVVLVRAAPVGLGCAQT